MENIVAKKTDETLRRWETAIKDRNFDCIRNLRVAETRPEHFDRALRVKRFVELESANELKRDGLFDGDPEKQRKAIELLIGKPHKKHPRAGSVGARLQEILETKTESGLQKVESGLKYYGQSPTVFFGFASSISLISGHASSRNL